MTPEQIREHVDGMVPRVHENGSINAQHVAIEQTLRTRYGHASYIADLDGPGKFRRSATPAPVGASRAEAREQIARALRNAHGTDIDHVDGRPFDYPLALHPEALADAVLAASVVAEALAAREALRRVETELEQVSAELRRALGNAP